MINDGCDGWKNWGGEWKVKGEGEQEEEGDTEGGTGVRTMANRAGLQPARAGIRRPNQVVVTLLYIQHSAIQVS
jgi:hypothetical protein